MEVYNVTRCERWKITKSYEIYGSLTVIAIQMWGVMTWKLFSLYIESNLAID